ncbi:MAG: HAMP domain-containing sensor histidine kinase [Rhodospirillaceae bacterium]
MAGKTGGTTGLAGWRGVAGAAALLVLLAATPVPAADLPPLPDDIGASFAQLQLAVIDRLTHGEDDDAPRAAQLNQRLIDRLAALAALRSGDDRQRVEEAGQRLQSYWQGFRRVLELRRQRDRSNENSLQPIALELRLRLQRIMAASKPAEAAIAGDAVISLLLVQQSVERFITRRDPRDPERARQDLDQVRSRLSELGKLQLDAPVRAALSEVNGLVRSYGLALNQLEAVVTDEARVSAEVIDRGGEELKALLGTPGERSGDAAAAGDNTLMLALAGGMGALSLGLVGGWLLSRRRKPPPRTDYRALYRKQGQKPAPTLDAPKADSPAEPHSECAPEPVASPPAVVAAEPPPPSPVSLVHTPGVTDWLAGMGRTVATLHASGTELVRAREEAEKVQAELQRAVDAAESRNRAMAGFLAHMGEHLEGPLSSIIRHGDQLLGELDQHGVNQLTVDVERIQWSGEQVLRTVEALRALALIQAGALTVDVEEFLVEHLVAEMRERLRMLTGLYGNRLAIQAAPGIGRMHSDIGKIRSALLHLMENACKFTEDGDVTLTVVRVDEDGHSRVRFTVTDTGSGIAPEHLRRIFDPFVSFGNGRSRGAGLGLALVHNYAERLGGTVAVESAPGKGSSFVLTIPAELPPAPGEFLPPEQPKLAAPGDERPS